MDWIAGVDRPGWGGEVTLQLPFLPWTDRRGRVAEAEAVRGGAAAKLTVAERSLEATIRNAFAAVRSAGRQLASFEGTLLADAEDAMRAATQNYRAGQIDGLELFETLRSYRTIQIEHVRALLNYELARTDLYTAE
jgi:outer membrane protein TolC